MELKVDSAECKHTLGKSWFIKQKTVEQKAKWDMLGNEKFNLV